VQEARDRRQRAISEELELAHRQVHQQVHQGSVGTAVAGPVFVSSFLTGAGEQGFEPVAVEHKYQMSSSYVTGDVVLSNFSALLLCQAFFNPHIIGIISTLLGARMRESRGDARSQVGHADREVYFQEYAQEQQQLEQQKQEQQQLEQQKQEQQQLEQQGEQQEQQGEQEQQQGEQQGGEEDKDEEGGYEPPRSCMVQIPIPASFLLAVARTREGKRRRRSEMTPKEVSRPLAITAGQTTKEHALEQEKAKAAAAGLQQAKAKAALQEEEGHALIEFEYAALFAYMLHADRDVLPVGVFRVGTESREGLSVRPFLDAHALSCMPKRSFLITNPEPEQLVCEHDLVFCLVYQQSTWEALKAPDSPYTNRPSPLCTQVKQEQQRAEKEAAEAAARAAARAAKQVEAREEATARAKWEKDMDMREKWTKEREERRRREAEGSSSSGCGSSGLVSIGELQQGMEQLKQQGQLKDERIAELQALVDKMGAAAE
jgi:hypothetical protein